MSKKTITIRRYRPLWGLFDTRWDDDWDDLTKLATKITGGDNAHHIRYCVKHGFLDVDLVFDRIKEFTDKKESFPFQIKDADSVYADLNRTVTFCKERLNEIPERSGSLEELLLLMFELGTQVGALNNQDLIQKGRTSIIEKHVAGNKRAEQKVAQGENRKNAYRALMQFLKDKGIGHSVRPLKQYLKSLGNTRFQTGIDGCEEIWIEGNDFFDSIGKYGDSAVSKIKL